MKKISRKILIAVLIVSTLFLAAFTPAIWPQSAGVAAATPAPPDGKRADKNMAFNLQREQNALQRQQLHLTRAGQVAVKAQDLISKAQAKGINVDDLVKALAEFNTKLASAQKSHDQAASILNTHAGFDSSGKVTDRAAAHQTLVDARDALRQAHLTLESGVLTLRTAIQEWRIQNKGK
jgi:hypothetical protein